MQEPVSTLAFVVEDKPQWETPELVTSDVSSATLAGNLNTNDGGGLAS